jgi:hypothetical protein
LRKASKIASIALLSLLLASISAAVYAQTTVNVTIRNPNGNANGQWSSSCWVGEIPITVSGEPATSDQQTVAYCMNYDKTVYVGSTYSAELAAVADSAKWRAVSYVLTWYHPPANDYAAAENQVAIWKILDDSFVKPGWLPSDLNADGEALANDAMGKDVVRQGDVFQWIEPVTSNHEAVMGNPGETITFKVQLTDAGDVPRQGVKVLFTAVLRPYDLELDSVVAYTGGDGVAEVSVKVPDDIKNGESIEVKAATRGVWPRLYLDLEDDGRQDLIGFGTCYELTVSTNVCVLAYILVIPEVPLGTLTAGAACALAFMFWKRGGSLRKPKVA